jgi:hypothetical protein
MPKLVKCLRDVERGCRLVLAVIEGVDTYADRMRRLVYSIVECLGQKSN